MNQDERIARTQAFLEALGKLEFDTAGAMLADDAVVEFPYSGAGERMEGKTAIIRSLRDSMAGRVKFIRYNFEAYYLGQDPEILVTEFSSVGMTVNDHEFRNRLIGVVRMRQGKIVLFREYFHPGNAGG